jgi:Mrp family chromosome partitioning ATPase
MPETATAPARFVAEAGEAAEDAMDRLRRRVISAQRDGGAASVVLLATDPGSRSAQTALTLARHMARSGRVILLDVAMRTGRYGRAMAAPLPLGLTELLIGEAAFGETIHRDRGSTLHIMPGGQAQVDLVDHAELLALTLDALSQTYDVVVMDADRAEEVLAGVTADADAVVVITAGGGEAEETRWRHQLAAVGIDEVLFTPPVDALPRAANDRAMLASVAE